MFAYLLKRSSLRPFSYRRFAELSRWLSGVDCSPWGRSGGEPWASSRVRQALYSSEIFAVIGGFK
jgi:hypothetical protein